MVVQQDQPDNGREMRWQLSLVEKVVGSSIIALLAWMAITTQQTATRVAVIEAKLTAVQDGRYTVSDATRDRETIRVELRSLEARIVRLEGKHGE